MTASATGPPRSVLSLVELLDLRRQLQQCLHPERRQLLRLLAALLDRRPRPAVHQHRVHPGLPRRSDVVVDAVTDVQHLTRLGGDDLGDVLEEGRVRLRGISVVAGADEVDVRGEELAEDLACPDGLVSGDAEPQATGAEGGKRVADVGVKIVLAEGLGVAGAGAPLAFGVQVESGPELLVRLP